MRRIVSLTIFRALHYNVCVMLIVTKSAQKNRRKKQQQPQQVMSGRSQEQRDAVSMATHLMGGAGSEGVSGGGGGDIAEKKIRNLKKVGSSYLFCNQIGEMSTLTCRN